MTRRKRDDAAAEPVPALVIIDRERRSYLGLSRDGTYWHHVRPAQPDDSVVVDGYRRAGELQCDCKGGRFRGTCYWTEVAEAREALEAAGVPAEYRPLLVPWLDSPAGAGEAVEAFRG